jgi:secreted trypsin-like serine protease
MGFFSVHPQLPRIVGGYPTTIDQFPIMAQMLRMHIKNNAEQYVQHCAAVIVTSRHLISTAHCFQYDAVTGIE